ncbi:MAG: DMT family transporter [Bryobacterales bacterium]|nr:DMT family transporter [Bryobacterales bacterium]
MATKPATSEALSSRSLHTLGVASGLAAGAWLGMAEAPTKLVTVGFSPFIISLGMVAGVFVARWTLPMLLKGTGFILDDLREKPHLIVWAILAGMLWAVANTLTVFAIRNVGISIAFPLWNTNSLVGLFWGWLLFRELRGAGAGAWTKVLGGAGAIVTGACMLAYATSHSSAEAPTQGAAMGILAALGAGLLWGTMYIPYRKAYISGMNPLSFVTVFTFGELGTVSALAILFDGGYHNVTSALAQARPALFWLFLGGFCWVIGDLFQQYAAKYIGIGRGIPLSNTNQLWGLAWGALVFGEMAALNPTGQWLVILGSLIMIAGAVSISFAEAPESEQHSWKLAVGRECERYGLDEASVSAIVRGDDPRSRLKARRSLWEWVVAAVALAVFVWLAAGAQRQHIPMNAGWAVILAAAAAAFLLVSGWMLWKRTRFS